MSFSPGMAEGIAERNNLAVDLVIELIEAGWTYHETVVKSEFIDSDGLSVEIPTRTNQVWVQPGEPPYKEV